MSEINDTNEMIDQTPEEVAEETAVDETVDTGVEETADETAADETADNSAEEAEEETAHEYVFSNSPVSIPDYIPESGESASKKTTAVLIGIILVLVAVIIIFGVLVIKQFKENKEAQKAAEELEQITSEPIENVIADNESEPAFVIPEYDVSVELGQYVGIEVDYVCEEITDIEVASEVAYFLDSYSEEQEVTDRPIQNGDIAYIDFVGYIDGVEFEGGSGTDYDLEIGSHSFIDGFEDALIGAVPGDVVDVNISFPDPYPNNPDLSGSPVLFVVTINSVSEYITPELTDEFVAENTEYETAQEYVAYVRSQLEEEAAAVAQETAETAIMEAVINNATFSGDIEEEIAFNTEQYLAYFDSMAQAYYGIDGATLYEYMYGMSSEEYLDMMSENVGYSIKYQYVLDAVAEKENMTVSEEEFDIQFTDYFIDSYGYEDKAAVLADLQLEYPGDNPESKLTEMVNQMVLRDKAEKFLLENSIIKK